MCPQIDEVLKDSDKVLVMEDHVEQLLLAMSMQFKMAYSTHMADEDTTKDQVIRLYRCLLATLVTVSCLLTMVAADMLVNCVYGMLLKVMFSKDIMKNFKCRIYAVK